jgi:hypothetical protein
VLLLHLVEQHHALAAVLFVLRQVPRRIAFAFAAIRDPLQLAPAFAEREPIFDVDCPL